MPRKKHPVLKLIVKPLAKPAGDIIATDVVMWGLVDGDGRLPEFLAAKRAHAQIVLDSLPESMREKLSVARTYVTIQVLEGRQRRPVKRAS